MNQSPKFSDKDLAYYQDGLLLDEERIRMENDLQNDPASQQRIEQLQSLDRTLQTLGQRERIREKVHAAVHHSTTISEPTWRDGFTFFPLKTIASCAVLLVLLFGVWIAHNGGSHGIDLLQKNGLVSWNALHTDRIQFGDQIVSGKDSYAKIRMADGQSIVELGPDSAVTLLDRRQIRIDRGVVCNTVGKDPSHPYRVLTPNGTITVLGTIFETVVTSDQTGVSVLEGNVQLAPKDQTSSPETVSAGYQTTLTGRIISPRRPVQPASFASWRNKYSSKTLDIHNIADVISDTKTQP